MGSLIEPRVDCGRDVAFVTSNEIPKEGILSELDSLSLGTILCGLCSRFMTPRAPYTPLNLSR